MTRVGAGSIDGLEDPLARIAPDDGGALVWPLAWLPDGASEGARLVVERLEDGSVRLSFDAAESERIRRGAQERLDALTSRPGDDFTL